MERFIKREAAGTDLDIYVSPEDLETDLRNLEAYPPFLDVDMVTYQMRGEWREIKQFLQDIERLADLVRGTDFEKGSEPDKIIVRLSEQGLIKS
jgi:hypothetical protein